MDILQSIAFDIEIAVLVLISSVYYSIVIFAIYYKVCMFACDLLVDNLT